MESNKLNVPKDFFKQFKSKEEFQEFFQNLFKEGVQEMLQGELDEHLGYEKHSPEGYNTGNSRNGSSKKKVKTETLGDMVLNIPRDRKSTFEPQLIPKHERMSDKIEQVIIGMYSRGMTTRDIEDQVKEIYGVDTPDINKTFREAEHQAREDAQISGELPEREANKSAKGEK